MRSLRARALFARRTVLSSLAALLLLSTPPVAHGAPSELEIPDPLKPWVGWVKHDLPTLECAWLPSGGRQCAWPSQLNLTVDDKGARFEFTAWLDRETTIHLPGDKAFWPQDVRGGQSGQEPLVVMKDGSLPAVRLQSGSQTVTGTFRWPEAPEVLRVPPEIGWVNLQIGGTNVAYPRLDSVGRLWLQDGSGETGEPAETDSLRVSVYRKVEDGVPLKMTTRLDLKVSGTAREIALGRILLPGSRPRGIDTQIPTQVSAEGMVKVYARPGTHHIEIESLLVNATSELEVPPNGGESFEPTEVWVWVSDERLRSVEVSGLTAVDAERTSLPQQWRGFSSFMAKPGERLVLTETRRGEAEVAPNLLNLRRQLWLDLDGRGYTVRDTLSGTINQGWRLNHTASGTLGRVNAYSGALLGDGDLLITAAPEGDLSGVELRQTDLKLSAELRLEEALRELNIVGWDHDVQSLSAQLHLPPGWELLGGQGVDQMHGTWFASWTLFDFFFVLMVALALGKLCGWAWTPVAGVALCLSHGYGDAPEWLWIHLLATLALLRVLPEHWFRRLVLVYRSVILVALVVSLAGYAHEQIRYVLHPQVPGFSSQGWSGADHPLHSLEADFAEEMAAWEEEEEEIGAPPAPQGLKMKKREMGAGAGSGRMKSIKLGTKRSESVQNMLNAEALIQVDPNAKIQTGPGVPTWQWNRWDLSWSGPVSKDHQVNLWLLSPWMSRTLTVLRVLFLLLMAFALIGRKDMTWVKEEEAQEPGDDGPGATFARSLTTPAVALLIAMTGLGAFPSEAHAWQDNDADEVAASLGPLLTTLERRLDDASRCEGPCVVVSRADVSVSNLDWALEAEIHVQRDSAWSLPGPTDALQLKAIEVNGEATTQLRRDPGGLTMVRLPAGTHTLVMKGQLADRQVVTLQFHEPTRPQHIQFTSEDWTVDGISKTGIPDSSIQLTRRKRADSRVPASEVELTSELPPWFKVYRHFAIGLPWYLDTTVSRTQTDRPQLVKIPLVEGEQVISADARVEAGHVLVDFPRGTSKVSYRSELPIKPQFSLKAPEGKPWSEEWNLACSRIWRCDFAGPPPTRTRNNWGAYSPNWNPWPGEEVTVTVLRPEGTPGQASTVDEVRYTATPGQRLLRGDLTLSVRASQGDWQKVTLPDGAELQTVLIDGSERNIRPQGQVVSLPLTPGDQVFELTWQQPWTRGFREEMPTIAIGSSAVNAHLTIHRGADRWLLWTTGPSWGPAVLFWGHVVILLLLALILGRLRGLPLRTWEWFLLALGMVQLPFVALVPVVGWFAALAWRRHAPMKTTVTFNLVQVALVGLTLVTAGILFSAIHSNLLVDMDMQVQGASSTNGVLRWYIDQVGETLPTAGIISVPLLAWRLSMLVWALWLVGRLLKWLPWAWERYSHEGLWRSAPKPAKVQAGGGAYASPGATVPEPSKESAPLPDGEDKQEEEDKPEDAS